MKCKYCSSETIEEPQDFAKDLDPYDLVYGDCQYRCVKCGSIGYEIFGHGVRWEKKKHERKYIRQSVNKGEA